MDRLGARLCRKGRRRRADLELLDRIIDAHFPAMEEAQRRVRDGVHVEATGRTKSAVTLIEKLKRGSPSRLSQVQDIVGARIVEEMTLRALDALVGRIRPYFPKEKVVDRRKKPSHGYRAVHVIVQIDGMWIELQVRTALQHLWAETTEKLADEWGRQIRYGELPSKPNARVRPGVRTTRADVIGLLKNLSLAVEAHEQMAQVAAEMKERVEDDLEDPDSEADATLRGALSDLEEKIAAADASLQTQLATLKLLV